MYSSNMPIRVTRFDLLVSDCDKWIAYGTESAFIIHKIL